VGAGDTTFADGNLASGLTYWYRVRAVAPAGDSPPSNAASATTPSGPPAAPASLGAKASSGRIDLTWKDQSPSETGFVVERSTDGRAFAAVATLAANTTCWSNTGLKRSQTYYYRVSAFNAAGSSSYTNVASARTPLL